MALAVTLGLVGSLGRRTPHAHSVHLVHALAGSVATEATGRRRAGIVLRGIVRYAGAADTDCGSLGDHRVHGRLQKGG